MAEQTKSCGEILFSLKGKDILTYSCNIDNIKGMMSSEIMKQKAERQLPEDGKGNKEGVRQVN